MGQCEIDQKLQQNIKSMITRLGLSLLEITELLTISLHPKVTRAYKGVPHLTLRMVCILLRISRTKIDFDCPYRACIPFPNERDDFCWSSIFA